MKDIPLSKLVLILLVGSMLISLIPGMCYEKWSLTAIGVVISASVGCCAVLLLKIFYLLDEISKTIAK